MAELLDSDRAKPTDARAAAIVICVCIIAVIAFALFGKATSGSNDGAAPKTGESGLKVGVEAATSDPQQTVPH